MVGGAAGPPDNPRRSDRGNNESADQAPPCTPLGTSAELPGARTCTFSFDHFGVLESSSEGLKGDGRYANANTPSYDVQPCMREFGDPVTVMGGGASDQEPHPLSVVDVCQRTV